MAIVWAVNNGNWSNTATWSGSYIPQPGDDVFANNRTVDVDVSFEVATLRSTSGTGITAGGSFRFSSGSISGSVTSTTPLVPGATNLIQITATSGTVTLSLGGNTGPRAIDSDTLIIYTGGCNLTISGGNFQGGLGGVLGNCVAIRKTSSGLITINGNLISGVSNGSSQNNALISTAGNTIINGSVSGFGSTNSGPNYGINQSIGLLTINGDIAGGGGSGAGNIGVIFTGTALTITGNIAGGATGVAVNTTAPTFVTGNITGSAAAGIITTAPVIVTGSVVAQGAAAGISSTSAIFINVSGSVYASATGLGISATNASAVVNLAGNMYNVNGKQAIYCQNLFLSNTDTTQAQFFTNGSQDRTLYSSDTFPNLPTASNVRFGTTYGPGSGNTGILRMASPQDVRSGVLTDNTTGSAILSAQSLFDEISGSNDPFAQRLRNISTVDSTGYLLTAFKK